MVPQIAVIGAGPLGLMAMKNLKEDGFDVTCYEARGYVGGLWKPSEDSVLSVQDSTVFNSSRYRSAFTDFPFPEDTDDFPTWKQMYRYMNSYCDHFDLRSRIHLNTPVKALKREDQKWTLEIDPKDSQPRVEYFDKIVTATGSFSKPKSPKFAGIDLFKGQNLHAIDYQDPSQFKGNNVLIVGFHATTQDVAKSLEGYASQLYISHRNGLTLFPRYTADGATCDQTQNLSFLFFQTFMSDWFPNLFNWMMDKALTSISKKAYPDATTKWKFFPAPSIATTAPLIADEIYPLLEKGFAEPVTTVRRITGPKTIELTDGRILSDIDAIIYCTGYDFIIPFSIPAEYNPYPVLGEPPTLYRNTFPLHPDPSVRNSLAFLGQVAVPFPGFALHEMMGMAVSQIWLGNSSLPSHAKMIQWHRDYLAWRKSTSDRQKIKSTFYTAFVPLADHIKWLDRTAGTGIFDNFGWSSARAWAFWWREKELYKKCLSGLLSPAMWRLFDMGKRKPWTNAKEQILEDNERAARQVRERQAMMEKLKNV